MENMVYGGWTVEMFRRKEGCYVRYFRSNGSAEPWEQGPSSWPKDLVYNADRTFLWELEAFPDRRGPEREERCGS